MPSASSAATSRARAGRSTSAAARSCGHALPSRTARGGSPARADLHAVDEGGGRPRREHHPRPSWPTWSAPTSRASSSERSLALYVEGGAPRRGGRADPGRHEVRVRLHRRRAGGDRRGPDARLQPILGRRAATRRAQSPPSFDKQFVRDFVAASGWNREPPAPTLPDEVIDGHARPLRRRLRAPDRPHLGVIGRALAGRGARRACGRASPIRRARRSGPRCARSGTTRSTRSAAAS